MVNSQISVAAVAGMPAGQAGLASGIASASRQVGQALGVAVAGSLVTEKTHGRLYAHFTVASHSVWHLLFWTSCVAVVGGLISRRAPARHAKTGDFRLRPPERLEANRSHSHTKPLALPEAVSEPQLESVWIPRRPSKVDSTASQDPSSTLPADW
jgi:hypothetical protein